MYCTNCGKEMLAGEKFCTGCGTPAPQQKKDSEVKTSFARRLSEKMNSQQAVESDVGVKSEKLEGKTWFRFLKVCYIFVFSVGILIIGGVFIGAFPQKQIDDNRSTIVCNNGKAYVLSKNSLYTSYNTLTSYSDEDARTICKYGTSYGHVGEFIPMNYTFSPVYTPPAIGEHILYFLAWLLGFIAVIKLIKIAVLYIFVGVTQWKKEFQRPY